MTRYTRRQFVASGAIAMAAASASFGSADTARSQTATRLRCFWWGNPDRDKRTKAALDAYKQRTGTEISAAEKHGDATPFVVGHPGTKSGRGTTNGHARVRQG